MKVGEIMDFRRNWVVFCLLGVTLLISSCGAEEEKKTAHLEEGNAFLVKGELRDAEKAFLRAIALDNRYKEAFVQLGIVQMRRGELRAAFASFTTAAEIDPRDLDVQLRLATFHMLGRDFSHALRILNNVLANDPGNIEALFLKGSLMVQQKKLHQATTLFRKIIELDSSQVRAYLALVKTLAVLGKTDDIIPLLHAAIDENPHTLDLKLALVDRYLGMDKITDAKGVLLDALQHDPGNPHLQEILGTFYFRIGQMDMAESAYKEAVRLSPMQVGPLMHLARFYDLSGNEAQAARTYEQALQIAPGNVQVLDTVSRFYAHANKLELAEKYVVRALEANPSFLPSRILQTELALDRGDFQTTLNLSDALLEDSQNLPKIDYLRGMALLAMGDLKEAQRALKAALDAWPRFVPARMGLARVLRDHGQPDQARAHALVVLGQVPADIESRLFLGTLAETRGDLAEAEKWYREILELDPGHGPAANNLAYILVGRDEHLGEALRLATLALEKMPDDPLVWDTMGLILLQLGKSAAALDYLVRSVDQNPENPLFLYHLGLAHFQERNMDQARQALSRALEGNATFQGQGQAREILDRLEADDGSTNVEAVTGE